MPVINIIIDYRKDERRDIEYECRSDGWYIDDDGWRKFAIDEASEETVRVLLRKEYSDLY